MVMMENNVLYVAQPRAPMMKYYVPEKKTPMVVNWMTFVMLERRGQVENYVRDIVP